MNREPESMVAVDIGSAYAKATLIDRVGDTHRFVVRGMAPQIASVNDSMSITAALSQAVRELETVSGRRITGADGLPITPEEPGFGVDAVGGVVTAMGVLDAAVVSLRDDRSLQLVRAALRAIPSRVVASITGKEIAGRGDGFEQFAQQLRDEPPHIILLTGGTDHKPDRAVVATAEALVVAMSLVRPQERPTLVYAGPQSLRAGITAAVAERLPLVMVENVLPADGSSRSGDERQPRLAPLRAELDRLYVALLGKGHPDLETLSAWCGGQPTTAGGALMLAYGNREYDILAADVGAQYTVLARPVRGQVLVEPDCGVGQGARRLLDAVGVGAVRAWLAGGVSESDVRTWALNKELRPWTRCASAEECAIELAFAREALRHAAASAWAAWQDGEGAGCTSSSPVTLRFDIGGGLAPKVDTVIGGGAVLRGSRSRVEAVSALVDGLQPVGWCRLALDAEELAPSLGAIANLNPAAARSVLDWDLDIVGSLIAPAGPFRPGRPALRLDVRMPNGDSVSIEVLSGTIVRIPLGVGLRAQAVIRPIKPYEVVPGAPGQGLEMEVEGGPLGIIVDARGRPLPDLQRLPDRVDLLTQWAAALGG